MGVPRFMAGGVLGGGNVFVFGGKGQNGVVRNC